MSSAEQMNPFTARFASDKTEAAYQAFVLPRNLRSNAWGVAIGIAFIGVYTFAEFIDSPDPSGGAAVRGLIVLISALLLSALLNKRLARHHDAITTTIVILMGVATNYNIWRQPSLDNTFYMGIIQGYIMFSLLLRLSFTSVVFVITFTQATFVAIVFSKADVQNAILQSANTFVVGVICIAGVYLLQRYQRTDFLKSQTIEEQNARLAEMLADSQRDNERKLAALNTLIHFVKTPIHQIVGFTDLIVSALKGMRDPAAAAQMEHAEFVKKASAELAANVARLLTYYRLDEQIKDAGPEAAHLGAMLDDMREGLPDGVSCTVEPGAPAISNYVEPVRVALDSLASAFADPAWGVSSVRVSAAMDEDTARIVFSTDGAGLTPERFAELSRPLTRITNYLTADGLAMPMALRTAARAAEICGGGLEFERDGERNIFILRLADLKNAARRSAA